LALCCRLPPLVPTAPSLLPLSLHDALPISGWSSSPRSTEKASSTTCASSPASTPRPMTECWRGCANGTSTRRIATANRSQSRRRSEEHTSELQSRENLVCRLLLEKKNRSNE